MASVHRATDRVLQRMVAVKVLGPPHDQDPAFVERFRREARAAAGLSHPSIVAIFDSGSQAGVHFIVMEYVQGETLTAMLRRQGVFAPRQAAEVARWVCQALAAAHARGLVHRDIKPANVMVTQAGVVKVMDFGIAKAAATPTLTGSGMLLGTAAYLSPEQARGGPVDARSDLYSLGCVLYELLTGMPPVGTGSPLAVAQRQVTEEPEPPSRRNPQVGVELEAVVLTALAKQPGLRYQTADAMGQALARSLGGVPGDAVPPAADGLATQPLATTGSDAHPTAPLAARAVRVATAGPGRTRWPLVAATGVGILVLLVVALWWLGDDRAPTGQPQTAPPPTQAVASTRSTTSSTAPTPTTTTAATPTTQSQAGLSAAHANLVEVVTAGLQQGSIEPAGEDLLHQAEEVLRAVQEGHGDDAGKKLEDLERKSDELIEKGKISPAAAGEVRQAVAQFSSAVERAG
jgi:hypothetical protein